MRQRRTTARCGILMLTMSAVLLAAQAPALIAADEELPAPDTARTEQPPAGPAPTETTAAPRLNAAKQLDLGSLAAKAARYPNNPYILNEYGNQLLRRGRLVEATASYAMAVELNPNFVHAWNNLALAYQAQREFGKAKGAYNEALELAPNFAIVHYNLGTVHEASGSYTKMIKSYQRALELEPRLSQLDYNPQIGVNKHVSAVLLQSYVDKGGSVYYPVLSAYANSK